MHRIELAGKTFGAWFVVRFAGKNSYGQTCWTCICECGTERDVNAQTLRNGLTHSCGCKKGDLVSLAKTKHGHSRNRNGKRESRTYVIWAAMHGRCNGSTEDGRKYWQSRGIVVCERWNSFENFLADMGEAPVGLSIDRIDNDGNYEPGNCRWATPLEQRNNQRPRSVQRDAFNGRYA